MAINIKTLENLQFITTYIPSMKKRKTFAAIFTSGYTKLSVTQSTTHSFEYILCCVIQFVHVYYELRQHYRVNDFVMKKKINENLQINLNENTLMCRMLSETCLHVYMQIQITMIDLDIHVYV